MTYTISMVAALALLCLLTLAIALIASADATERRRQLKESTRAQRTQLSNESVDGVSCSHRCDEVACNGAVRAAETHTRLTLYDLCARLTAAHSACAGHLTQARD
jgi:hypothetical protein